MSFARCLRATLSLISIRAFRARVRSLKIVNLGILINKITDSFESLRIIIITRVSKDCKSENRRQIYC